jgi:uncharacterized protein YndB with AHSA1/START domain
MPVLRLSQVIHRPVADVFRAVVDVEGFPRWNPTTKAARRLDGGGPASGAGNGSRFELEIAGFGKTLQELDEYEVNRRVRLVPHIKQISGGHRFTFTPQGSDTRIDHELEMTPRGVFRLMSPIFGLVGRKNLRATADALKRFLESESPGSR